MTVRNCTLHPKVGFREFWAFPRERARAAGSRRDKRPKPLRVFAHEGDDTLTLRSIGRGYNVQRRDDFEAHRVILCPMTAAHTGT